jgi:hypothetical protein
MAVQKLSRTLGQAATTQKTAGELVLQLDGQLGRLRRRVAKLERGFE